MLFIRLTVPTIKQKQIIDITNILNKELEKFSSNSGLVHLHLLHTTAALTTADLDPGTDLDILDAFEAMIPKLQYRHPHNPEHVPDHILSALIGTSLLLPFEKKELILGTWQRVVLMEFDGPRQRNLIISSISHAS